MQKHITRAFLELGQLLDRLPEDNSAGDVDVERANKPTLRNLYTVINLNGDVDKRSKNQKKKTSKPG